MTFEYRDAFGAPFYARPIPGTPHILIETVRAGAAIPADRVEEVVAGIREARRQATATKPPTAYGDGKGRVYCLACASAVGADVALSIDHVDHWELCSACGRYLVDVARQATAQPAAGRTLTPLEHDRAWHAIEHAASQDDADPGTVLNAVLRALRINPPTIEDEQAAGTAS